MKKITTIMLLLMLIIFKAEAQNRTIKGKVINEGDKAVIEDVLVTLSFREGKEVTTKRTNTNKQGLYIFKDVPTNSFSLIFERIDFYKRNVYIENSEMFNNIYDIQLKQNENVLLSTVVVKNTLFSKRRIIGDTLIYDGLDITVNKNAKLSGLLEKIPFLKIENGIVFYNNKVIKTLLLDGKPYFLGNTDVLLSQLDAVSVKQIEIVNDKSNDEILSGVSEYSTDKLINVVSSDLHKNSFSGYVQGLYGSDNRYSGIANINYSKDKSRIGLFFNASNNELSGTFSNSSALGSAGFYGYGLPKTIKGGIQFNQSFKKSNLNINYEHHDMKLSNDAVSETKKISDVNHQNGINTIENNNNSLSDNLNLSFSGRANKLSYSISSQYRANHFASDLEQRSLVYNNLDSIISNGQTNAATKGKESRLSSILYLGWNANEKNFFSLTVSNNYLSGNASSLFNSSATFYNTVHASIIDSVRENQLSRLLKEANQATKGKFHYSYKANETVNFITELEAGIDKTDNDILAINRVTHDVIAEQSSDFSLKDKFIMPSFFLNYSIPEFSIRVGGGYSYSTRKQPDNLGLSSRAYKYFRPSVNLMYKYAMGSFNASYQGIESLPSIQQLQPVTTLTDATSDFSGNSNLSASYNNAVNITNIIYDEYRNAYYSITAGLNMINNPVGIISFLESSGYNSYTYGNIDKINTSSFGGVAYEKKIDSLSFKFGIDYSSSKLYTYINDDLGYYRSNNLSLSNSLRYSIVDNIDLINKTKLTYNVSKNSVNESIGNKGLLINIQPSVQIFLPADFEFKTAADILLLPKTSNFGSGNRYLWNAEVNKRFFKDGRLIVGANVFDILNKNAYINRSAFNNVIQQSRYNTLGRYFGLRVIYEFKNL